MKRVTTILAVLALVVTTMALASQQTAERSFFAGIVLAVDPANDTISLEEASLDAETRTFRLAREAEVTRGGQSIELGGIRVGDPVSIEYESEGGASIAHRVKLLTPPTS